MIFTLHDATGVGKTPTTNIARTIEIYQFRGPTSYTPDHQIEKIVRENMQINSCLILKYQKSMLGIPL